MTTLELTGSDPISGSDPILGSDPKTALAFVKEYTQLKVADKEIRIPYTIRQDRPFHFWEGTLNAGKGSPWEIRQALLDLSKKRGLNLARMTKKQIEMLMRREKLGIDCSGFAYRLLDFLGRERDGKSLANDVAPPFLLPWGPLFWLWGRLVPYGRIRQMKAAYFFLPQNSQPVKNRAKIRVGDLIKITPRFYAGGHLMVVVKATRSKIVYAHSSRDTEVNGVHLGTIRLIRPEGDLGQQDWEEKLFDGKSLKEVCFRPEKGDGVYRLKAWI